MHLFKPESSSLIQAEVALPIHTEKNVKSHLPHSKREVGATSRIPRIPEARGRDT